MKKIKTELLQKKTITNLNLPMRFLGNEIIAIKLACD